MHEVNSQIVEPERIAYDAVPYPRAVFTATYPGHLEMVGRLFCTDPQDSQHARILEIGCAHGSNLIPMALELPSSVFYGIDISPVQVAQANADIIALGLKNIIIEEKNILDLNDSLGEFDYIIAHGIYSWVPAKVRQGILSALETLLAPRGIAFLSYNANPGWKMRSIVRDLMLFHTRNNSDVGVRLTQSRGILEFIAANTMADTFYKAFLQSELESVKRSPDNYVYHDMLEGTNEAFYLEEVVNAASEHGLRYLGDSELYTMFKSNFGPEVQQLLAPIGGDTVATEQYLDFFRNRAFRQSVFVRKEVNINRAIDVERLHNLFVSARVHPSDPNIDILSESPTTFTSATKAPIHTSKPIVKAALMYLRERWSQPVAFEELSAQAIAMLERIANDRGFRYSFNRDQLSHELGEVLIYLLSTDSISLHVHPFRFAPNVSERPMASPLALLEASRGQHVSNLRHEQLALSGFDIAVLGMLDGTMDREGIAEKLLALAQSGKMKMDMDGNPIVNLSNALDLILNQVDETLLLLARGGLLVG